MKKIPKFSEGSVVSLIENAGARIRSLRSKKGFSLEVLAGKVYVSQKYPRISAQHLSRIERGERRPSPEVLDSIAHALGVNLLQLIDTSSLRPKLMDLPSVRPRTYKIRKKFSFKDVYQKLIKLRGLMDEVLLGIEVGSEV